MKFDLLVIQSGPGGYLAAIRAPQLGMKRPGLGDQNSFVLTAEDAVVDRGRK
jgi:pyruvate/2-oxoglutarate dehydrogenase complex dihydrolipoamide dehydrogenase (E3) component